MKSKKGIIILSSVVIACAVGFIVSPLVNWSVDSDSASGDIGKSSRFSRKTAAEGLTNMEELILNDESFKDGVVVSYVVMQTRAQQFGALVDASNEVAADIPEFASLLKDMNDVRATVGNVCSSLAQAGSDLNAALGGEKRPDLAQNTMNASLAYVTLQKQNKLADRFIAAADNYIKKAAADDRLKFVRDQWVTYQQMTAALDGDKKSLQALEDKGYMLSPEEGLATMKSFDGVRQLCFFESIVLCENFKVDSPLGAVFQNIDLNDVFTINSSQVMQGNTAREPLIDMAFTQLGAAVRDALSMETRDALGESAQVLGESAQVLGESARMLNESAMTLGESARVLSESARVLSASPLILSSFGDAMKGIDLRSTASPNTLEASLTICEELGNTIDNMAIGARPEPLY